MQFANDPGLGMAESDSVQTYIKEQNAYFYNDYTLVASKEIRCGEEILINYYDNTFYVDLKEKNEKKRKFSKLEKAKIKRQNNKG